MPPKNHLNILSKKRGSLYAARYHIPDGKTFRQFHFDGAAWLAGGPSGKWPLYRVEQLPEAGPVHLLEGEKCAIAAAGVGIAAVSSAGGAQAAPKTDWTLLAGRDVYIWPDADKPGEQYAATVAGIVTGLTPPARVKIVRVPYPMGSGKDIADFLADGAGLEDLDTLIEDAPEWTPPTDDAAILAEPEPLPPVVLPHGIQSISGTGRALGGLLANTQRYFIRGGAVVKLSKDPDGLPVLDDVKHATLSSDFETVAILCKLDGTDDAGQPKLKPATCPEQTAKMIATSTAFRESMPPINVLTRCPVQVERGGSLVQVAGYDRESGIYAAGKPADPVSVDEARRLLHETLKDFKFATRADLARALAAMITPALVFGGLLRGRAPVDLGEADSSQTGKGYRNKLTAALYSQSVKTVTQQKSGVGGLEESFNTALIRGANFIALDNIRGRIDSPAFESFLTEDSYSARMPYREPVEIDPRRVVIMFTSNKADVTPDLANRSSCTRILKQVDGYTFATYPEGDILEHVRANQARFLGAVFSIVKAWYDAGRPRTTESRHDFRPWAQTLDWITRNLLDAGPLLDGHRETQARMTNPVLNWLRDVALEVIRAKQSGAWLRAGDLVDLISETGIETPGLSEHGDLADPNTRKAAQQATGRKLGLCFRAGDTISLDGMQIERRETCDEGRHTLKEYRFLSAAMKSDSLAENYPASHTTEPGTPEEQAPEQAEIDFCRYDRRYAAAMNAADKTLIAANAANTPLQGKHFPDSKESECIDIATIGTLSGIAATEDEINQELHAAALIEMEEGEL